MLDTIRDLIYKEENEAILQMYRNLSWVKDLGSPVEEEYLDMLRSYLTQYFPLWLVDDPSCFKRKPHFGWGCCNRIMDFHPQIREILRLIHHNPGIESEIYGSTYTNISCRACNVPGLFEGKSSIFIEFANSHFSTSISQKNNGSSCTGPRFSVDAFERYEYIFSPAYEQYLSSEEFTVCMNHIVGIKDYFREEGRISDKWLLK